MPKYFDFHSHLNFPDYDKDFEEVLGRLRETETHTIVVGTDLKSSKKAVELAQKYDGIYASIGVHPVDSPSRHFEEEEFSKLVSNTKVVAIGECGLDFFHVDKSVDHGRQKDLFLAQLDFALKHNKPLMIHSRDAYPELLEILETRYKEEGSKLRGNIHFFAGTLPEAKRFWAMGFTTSFTGVITFTTQYDAVIKEAPMDMLLSETDAPYVTPTPHRGKRNEPSFVVEVVKRMAEIRGDSFTVLAPALVKNALRMLV